MTSPSALVAYSLPGPATPHSFPTTPLAADHGYVVETDQIVVDGPAEALLADTGVIDAYLGETFDDPPANGATVSGSEGPS